MAAWPTKQKQLCEGPNLPEEMLTEILSKLPEKSVLRFTCVCKKWRDLLTTPSFGDKHLQDYCRKNDRQTLVYVRRWYKRSPESETEESILNLNRGRRTLEAYFNAYDTYEESYDYEDLLLSHEDHYSSPALTRRSLFQLPHHASYPGRRVIWGSCNGILLCLFSRPLRSYRAGLEQENIVHLYNPTTGEYVILPQAEDTEQVYTLGLGFDSSTNDYKVVMIYFGREEIGTFAKVYKLSTNSWSEVELVYKGIGPIVHGQVLMNGASHWKGGSTAPLILRFDFESEKFGRMELPESAEKMIGLLDVDGSLGFLTRLPNLQLWVMTEYGNKESWTKKFSVQMPAAGLNPRTGLNARNLICWKDSYDDRVELLSSGGRFISRLLEKKKRKAVTEFQIDCSHLEGVLFQPSLVSLRGRNI